jgi:hypothetical protein
MIIIILEHQAERIELLVNDDFDLALLTTNAQALFDLKKTTETALRDFLNDHSAQLDAHQPLIDTLKNAGVIGYPVTPMKDARLYAVDKKISIQHELEVQV